MNDTKKDILKTSHALYHLVLDDLGDGYWEWNVQTNEIKYSKQWKRLFGFEEHELEDTLEAWESRVHKDDLKKTILDLKNYLNGKTDSYSNEHRVKCKDGSYKWILDRGKIVEQSKDGKPLLMVGFKTDISNQKKLKEKLKINEELTNSLLANMPGVAFRCLPDEHWTMKFLSSAIKDLSGYEIDDLIDNKTTSFANLIFGSDRKRVKDQTVLITEKNPTYSIEYRIIHKSGKVIWVKDRGRGIFKRNKLKFIDGIIFEITDRKEVEDQIKKMNFQVKQAGNMAKVGFWELDLINKNLYWSGITRKIHELPKGHEIQLEEALKFYKKGKYRDEITRLVNNAIESGQPWETESKITTFKGNEIWVKSTGSAEIENGKCIRLFGSFQDINQIKKNSERLKTFDLLEKLTNSVPGAVYQFEQRKDKSISYKFLSENVSYLHKDLTKEAILKNPILPFNFVHPDDWNGFENSMREAYRNNKDWKYQYRMVNNDGSIFWHEAHSKPEMQKNGTINWYGYIHNITGLKELQHSLELKVKEISRKNKDLERFISKNQELERFAYIVSHDLKEPLRTIKSFSEIIKSKYFGKKLDEDAIEYFNLISNGATRMMGLIEGILEYSKIEEKKNLKENVDIESIVQVVVNDLKSVIEDTQAKIEFKDLHPVNCNPLQIRQLFQNLINNAIKFSSGKVNKPKIKISSTEESNNIIYSVNDNGIGIDIKQQQNVFGMFKRLHSKEDYQGYGIGLALCKRIVEKHNGKIWVESDGQSGSTFYFSIPK